MALYRAAEALSATAAPQSVWEEEERTRDRQTCRRVQVFAPSADPRFSGWKDLACIMVVERSGRRGRKAYQERHFYISSQNLPAERLAGIVRGHWQIENALHWPKDVVLKEDACTSRSGEAAQNLALLRNWVVNLYRLHGFRSLTRALRLWANDFRVLFGFLCE